MKLYIKSGELRAIVDAPSPEEGLAKAIRAAPPGTRLGMLATASQRGFKDHPEDLWISTKAIFEK